MLMNIIYNVYNIKMKLKSVTQCDLNNRSFVIDSHISCVNLKSTTTNDIKFVIAGNRSKLITKVTEKWLPETSTANM